MKKTALSLAVLTLFLTAAGVALAEDATTLTGQYVWSNRGSEGDLEAVFTPTGEGKWDVSFHFEFRGKAHVYSGTAEGSLTDGELKGTVLNENKKRTFTFSGSFEEGAFSGTHAEIEGDEAHSTGTLSLKG